MIDAAALYQQRRHLAGFALFPAIACGRTVAEGLGRLVALVAGGRLRIEVARRAPWAELPAIAAALTDRRFPGKAVLSL